VPKPTVALFITCLTDQFYPRVGVAVVKVLEKLGWNVIFPQEQTCCGQPFFNNGLEADAARLARRFIEIFEPFEHIVTPSGSCCAVVRHHFPEVLAADPAWHERAGRVGQRTFEFLEFLDKVAGLDPAALGLPKPTTLTYHYTCHLRTLGIRDEPVRFLKDLGNVDFVPLNKTEQCCGFGGTFALKMPHISGAMVEDKVQNIAATGAAVTVCNDAGCSMNIAGMCRRAGVQTRVAHVAELLAEAMGLSVDSLDGGRGHE
jgi:L-lactate dehydrogenase complex protein LldE